MTTTTINEISSTCNGLTLYLRGTFTTEILYELGTLETAYGWLADSDTTLDTDYTDGYVITST